MVKLMTTEDYKELIRRCDEMTERTNRLCRNVERRQFGSAREIPACVVFDVMQRAEKKESTTNLVFLRAI